MKTIITILVIFLPLVAFSQSFTIGNLPAGKTIVVTYDVDVNPCNGTAPANVSNQATVSGGNFATVSTDDPALGGALDPTITPYNIPQIDAGSTISSNVVCSGGTISLGAVCAAGTLNWYTASSGGSLAASGSPYNPANITTGTSYYAACKIATCESATTLVGAVQVNQPIINIVQASNKSLSGNGIIANGNTNFSISASNTTQFNWQENTGGGFLNINNGGVYNGANTITLSLTAPTVSLNNAQYQCVITGTPTCPSITTIPVTLKILSPALNTGLLTNTNAVDINAGADLDWTFYELANSSVFAIKWGANASGIKNSVNISLANGSQISQFQSSPKKGVFAMGRYWNITTSNPLTSPVDIRFYYTNADKNSVSQSATAYAVASPTAVDNGFKWFKTVGTSYDPLINITSNGISGNPFILTGLESTINSLECVQFNGITSFSGGSGVATVGLEPTALPVDLLFFKVEKYQDIAVSLSWATVWERNANSFTIERSNDLKSFQQIGNLKAADKQTERTEYQFTDKEPKRGINYYRLKQTDNDGSSKDYPIKAILFDSKNEIKLLYPNPIIGNIFYVDIDNINFKEANLSSILGQNIPAKFTKISDTIIEGRILMALPKGQYQLEIKTDKDPIFYKLLKE